MREKLESIFNALQALEIRPTPHNTSIMSGVYQILREVYQEMGVCDHVEGKENRAAVGSDGRGTD